MANTSDGARRRGRRPRRSRTVVTVGWLLVIVAAAVIPYEIAQATHGKTETTTTTFAAPTFVAPSPSASKSAVVSGASAAPVSTTPSSASVATSSAPAPTTATPTASVPASGAPIPVEPGGGNGGTPNNPAPAAVTYTVKPGDSLWAIAISRGAIGTPAIAALVNQIYTANSTVIGPNPSIVHPGQVLTLPS